MLHFRNIWKVTIARFRKDERGQSLLETTAFLVVSIVMLGFMVNTGYFFLSYYAAEESASKAALFAAEGQSYVSGGSSLPTQDQVTAEAEKVLNNLTAANNGDANPGVVICSPSSQSSAPTCAASGSGSSAASPPPADPEAGNNGTTEPQFQTVSVTMTYTIQPLINGSILGFHLLPFSYPQTFTETSYVRAMN